MWAWLHPIRQRPRYVNFPTTATGPTMMLVSQLIKSVRSGLNQTSDDCMHNKYSLLGSASKKQIGKDSWGINRSFV